MTGNFCLAPWNLTAGYDSHSWARETMWFNDGLYFLKTFLSCKRSFWFSSLSPECIRVFFEFLLMLFSPYLVTGNCPGCCTICRNILDCPPPQSKIREELPLGWLPWEFSKVQEAKEAVETWLFSEFIFLHNNGPLITKISRYLMSSKKFSLEILNANSLSSN